MVPRHRTTVSQSGYMAAALTVVSSPGGPHFGPKWHRRVTLCASIVFMADQLFSLSDVLAATDRRLDAGLTAAASVTPTGFHPLDTYLGGGLRAGELTLLGGPQGLGKTTMALQMLRNVVVSGGTGIYFSFEHDPATVLERFIAIEAASRNGIDAVPLRRIREAMESMDGHTGGLARGLRTPRVGPRRLMQSRSMRAGCTSTERVGERQIWFRSKQVVNAVIDGNRNSAIVVVDYLQKIPVLYPGDVGRRSDHPGWPRSERPGARA